MIDFKLARPDDPAWWLRLQLTMDQVRTSNRSRSMQREALRDLMIFASGKMKPEHEGYAIRDICDKLRGVDLLERGLPFDLNQERLSRVDAAWDDWEAEYGPRDDPETQANIEATIEILKRGRAGTR